MFRLLRLTLALIVTFAAAILVVRLIGGTQPSPIAPLFTNPDGSPCQPPCLFGIRPGNTTVDEAVALLKNHPLLENIELKVSDATPHRSNVIAQGKGVLGGKQIELALTTWSKHPQIGIVTLTWSENSTSGELPITDLGSLFAFLDIRSEQTITSYYKDGGAAIYVNRLGFAATVVFTEKNSYLCGIEGKELYRSEAKVIDLSFSDASDSITPELLAKSYTLCIK